MNLLWSSYSALSQSANNLSSTLNHKKEKNSEHKIDVNFISRHFLVYKNIKSMYSYKQSSEHKTNVIHLFAGVAREWGEMFMFQFSIETVYIDCCSL